MPQKKVGKIPSPVPFLIDQWASWRSFTLAAGIELDVFTHIAAGKRTAADVAAAAGAHPGAIRRLLDALVALKYLRRKADNYSLEPSAAAYLVRGSELYMESAAIVTVGVGMQWSRLAEAVRTGEAINHGGFGARANDFVPLLVKSLFPASYVAAKAAVVALGSGPRKRIDSILDVAAGSGAWSIAFAQAIPKARVTVVELPPIGSIAREYANRHGVADRYDYIEGDVRQVDFGRGRYDLVILGHIIHSEGADWGRKLIEKSAAALRDNGLLLIADYVPNDERTGPPIQMLFGLNMLLLAPGGNVFTMREYRAWLKDAGFRKIKTIRSPAPSPLILASKQG